MTLIVLIIRSDSITFKMRLAPGHPSDFCDIIILIIITIIIIIVVIFKIIIIIRILIIIIIVEYQTWSPRGNRFKARSLYS